jgi:hypothetical protein
MLRGLIRVLKARGYKNEQFKTMDEYERCDIEEDSINGVCTEFDLVSSPLVGAHPCVEAAWTFVSIATTLLCCFVAAGVLQLFKWLNLDQRCCAKAHIDELKQSQEQKGLGAALLVGSDGGNTTGPILRSYGVGGDENDQTEGDETQMGGDVEKLQEGLQRAGQALKQELDGNYAFAISMNIQAHQLLKEATGSIEERNRLAQADRDYAEARSKSKHEGQGAGVRGSSLRGSSRSSSRLSELLDHLGDNSGDGSKNGADGVKIDGDQYHDIST